MTKKIFIDETVVKQAIWTLEHLGSASDTDVSPKEWYEARGWSTLEALEAVIADQQTAEQRPQNCGTGFCSCIECPYEQPATQQDGTNGVVALQERLRQEPVALQPLTDEQCDVIYTALDEWSREVDAREFGLPAIAGGGMEKGREIIRAALNTTSNQGD